MSRRLTVIGSRRRIDAVLPDGVPVAELMPDLLDMLGESANGAAAEWGLVRVGGRALEPELSLAAQGVGDGMMLFVQDLAAAPSGPLIEDYAEQVAVAVDAQPGRWSESRVAPFLIVVATAATLAAGVVLLAAGDAPSKVVAGGAGAIVAATAALVIVSAGRSREMAVLVLFGGLALWAAAGAGLAGFAHASQEATVAAALGAIAVGAVAAVVIAGDVATTPGAGVLAATLIPALVAGAVAIFGGRLQDAAALVLPIELGALALAAPVTVRLAGVVGGAPSGLAGRLRRGRHLLAALLGGGALVIAGSCALLAAQGGWFARGLVAAAAIAAAVRARHFRFAAEVAPLLASALVSLAALEYPLALWLGFSARGIGDLAVLLIADAVLLVAVAMSVRSWEISALVRRWLGPVETVAIAATVPLALGAVGAFDAAVRFARSFG